MRRIRISDGTTWPWPIDENGDDVEWHLRYGNAEAERFVAAEVVAAYVALIRATKSKRERVIRDLRAVTKGEP